MKATTTEAILAELIGFDSVSDRSNEPIIRWIENYLLKLGLAPRLVARHGDASKFNLFVSIGPEKPGGICFSGHTDVVPVAGQNWTTDPFVLTQKGSRLYGRGSCDMKGFLACVLAKIPEMLAKPLKTPLHAIFSCDEEIGCIGLLSALEELAEEHIRPGQVIVGEPTEMEVVSAHKGIYHYITTVTGVESHSSKPHLGANALLIGAEIVGKLDAFAQELTAPERHDALFDPPFSTLHIGVMNAGRQLNIVPSECLIDWEIRALPSADPENYRRRLESWIEETLLPGGKFRGVAASSRTELVNVTPGFVHHPGNSAERLALRLARSNQVSTVPYGTEAGQFQAHQMDTVVIGPGSIDQAHKPDEFIEIASLRECEGFIDRVIEEARQG